MPANLNELEKKLWNSVDTLRANSKLKSSEYSIPVLGLMNLAVNGLSGASALDTVCEIKKQINVVLLSSVAILRPNIQKITSSYLHYFMDCESTRQYLKGGFVTSAAIPGVDLKDFKRCKVFLPPLPTQRKIASILSAYDDHIENNTRRIAILEAMARSLYNECFVLFRFPGYKKNKMLETELGLVPEGWEVKTVAEILDNTIGGGWGKNL